MTALTLAEMGYWAMGRSGRMPQERVGWGRKSISTLRAMTENCFSSFCGTLTKIWKIRAADMR